MNMCRWCKRWVQWCAWKDHVGATLEFDNLTWTEETSLKKLQGRTGLWCVEEMSLKLYTHAHIFVLYTVNPSVYANWHTPTIINWRFTVKPQQPHAARAPDNLSQISPVACSDFVIAPSTQLKLDLYSVNEHRATQWSLITRPSMRLPFSVTIADHHPQARWHRWQGLIGLTDRCQASWHVVANRQGGENTRTVWQSFCLMIEAQPAVTQHSEQGLS